ncbi:hypothetical protein [Ktedonobacter sp. SOSP1-52]|uniref:hypothetical protein n=1 Tax=Ktedonobacter sp. SOSP1-52 TaxID=2778366 RepID=UPI001915D813|nr:hypothetical protein [Ktedonobacter sp. SOSP1-52]
MREQEKTYHLVYTPQLPCNRATVKHSFARIPFSRSDAPGEICGIARRIGYSGSRPDDLALYRLKIDVQPQGKRRRSVMVDGYFVLDHGVFSSFSSTEQG